MTVKTKNIAAENTGVGWGREHFHPSLDRENWQHMRGLWGSNKVHAMGCTGRVAIFDLLRVIVRPFLLFPPQKLVSASFSDTLATGKKKKKKQIKPT